jgi:hypothetical protein
MSNVVKARRSLRAFLTDQLGADFNGKPLKPFNFFNTGAQGGIVFGEMAFIDKQNKGTRPVSIGQMFPVYTRSGAVPDLEDAYEQALALSDKIALLVDDWIKGCSNVAIIDGSNFTASGQVLPIDNVRSALKLTDLPASTSPTALPMAVQPITASYYAIAVVKFDMLYLANEDD